MRRYYLHTRNNGLFYAELVDPETGVKLTAGSTGTGIDESTGYLVAIWVYRKRKPMPCVK